MPRSGYSALHGVNLNFKKMQEPDERPWRQRNPCLVDPNTVISVLTLSALIFRNPDKYCSNCDLF